MSVDVIKHRLIFTNMEIRKNVRFPNFNVNQW